MYSTITITIPTSYCFPSMFCKSLPNKQSGKAMLCQRLEQCVKLPLLKFDAELNVCLEEICERIWIKIPEMHSISIVTITGFTLATTSPIFATAPQFIAIIIITVTSIAFTIIISSSISNGYDDHGSYTSFDFYSLTLVLVVFVVLVVLNSFFTIF